MRAVVATHCIKASRASWLIFSISSLVLLGLMVRASFSSYSSSSSPSSTWGLSRGMMMVPLDLRLPSFGRGRCAGWPVSLMEHEEDAGLMYSSSTMAEELWGSLAACCGAGMAEVGAASGSWGADMMRRWGGRWLGGEEDCWEYVCVPVPRCGGTGRWVGKVRSRYEVAASAAEQRERRADYQAPAR